MRLVPVTLLLISSTLCRAQTFDVASVKPQKWTGSGGVGVFVQGNTVHAEHADLNSLVEFAYNLKDFQLSGGPAWTTHGMLDSSELFEVLAKPAPGQTPTMDQFRLMMQALLAERFHLQIHHAMKELPAYNLVINKGGPKLKETTGGEMKLNVRSIGPLGLRIEAANITIQHAVESQLGLYADRPVFEKTGLTGHYDFSIEWLQNPTGPARSDLQTLPTALQDQLGLRLESTTASFDTVVIDSAEKPSPN